MAQFPTGVLITVLLVGLGALARKPALVDAATLEPVAWAQLAQPLGYLAGAPLFGVLDGLSLLTVSQHYAVLATLVALFLLRRVVVRSGAGSLACRAALEALRVASLLLAIVALYAIAALVPRPMVRLELTSPDMLAVNVHSHTRHSHDGRQSFSAADNRAWHAAGGFHAAYITDHYTWAGVDAALPMNPPTAGRGTVLLSGMEVRLWDRHVNVLGYRDRYVPLLESSGHHLRPDVPESLWRPGGVPPTLIYTLPGPLDEIVPYSPSSPAGVVGVEISDGAPRGLEQVRAQRAEILRLADRENLAIVAGANLHGWGRTVAAWSVMRVPGWQSMSPETLAAAIEATLHLERRDAVAVVERSMPYHDGSWLGIALTLPWLAWEHMRTLSVRERVSWLLWAALWGAVPALRRRYGRSPA